MLTLTIINSDNICYSYELDTTPGAVYRIGRSMDCEIALTEEIHLSRVHCILSIGEGCALLTDNNSSNGIFEDNNRVQEILMLPGKQYRISNCKVMLEEIPDQAAAEPAVDSEATAYQEEAAAYVYEEAPLEPTAEEVTPHEEPLPEPEPMADEAPAYEEPLPTAAEETVYEAPIQITETEEEPQEEPQPEPQDEAPAAELQPAEETPQPMPVEEPATAPRPVSLPKRKFIPPPPRKALVKRAAPRPFYTAAGTLSTEPVVAKPKELKHRRATNGIRIQRPPSQPASDIGLPFDFSLSMSLLNTTPTIEEGDLLNFNITAEEDCHVFLIQYDSEHNAAMLVPGVGGADNRLTAKQDTQFPPKGNNKYELYVEPPFGTDTILAIACTQKVDFVRMWKDCLAQADELSTIGEVEKQAIELCKDILDGKDAFWAAALLRIETGS